MKKIVTIVGARPQFIKAAVISRLIRGKFSTSFKEILVHTGQHYDYNMSDVFFKEMMIPEPDINLNIGSGSHGEMTGKMLMKIEGVLRDSCPDFILVYGDTNSTLAGALAASKILIPVIHVEAGLRSFNMNMPEEQNRILTDHLSSYLFCPTQTAINNLRKEGITKGVYLTGDIMLDASRFYRQFKTNKLDDDYGDFALITLHRAENTDNPERLQSIVAALNECGKKGILPIHPRTKKMLEKLNLSFSDNIKVVPPASYFEMIELQNKCSMILTDSGGVQKEAFFFKKPCITLRDQTEWIESVENGWNTIVGADREKILYAINNVKIPDNYPELYGNGKCGEEILSHLNS